MHQFENTEANPIDKEIFQRIDQSTCAYPALLRSFVAPGFFLGLDIYTETGPSGFNWPDCRGALPDLKVRYMIRACLGLPDGKVYIVNTLMLTLYSCSTNLSRKNYPFNKRMNHEVLTILFRHNHPCHNGDFLCRMYCPRPVLLSGRYLTGAGRHDNNERNTSFSYISAPDFTYHTRNDSLSCGGQGFYRGLPLG